MTLLDHVLRPRDPPGDLDDGRRARYERARLACKLEGVLVRLILDEDASAVWTFDERTGNVTVAIDDPLAEGRRMVAVEYAPGWLGRPEHEDGAEREG
jgi:hypothetical protein